MHEDLGNWELNEHFGQKHKKIRVVLAYKNFAANKQISHIGLGVAALNTCRTLTQEGIPCEVWPIIDANNLRQRIRLDQASRHHGRHHPPITHVVISAPWIPTTSLAELCQMFPQIHFAVNSHSNVGFLQADPNGMRLIREGLELEMATPNFTMSANSEKMCKWVRDAYGNPCQLLPNLYFINPGHHHSRHHRPLFNGGVLRIGCFGAIRPQKNLASSVAAGIEIGHQLKANTEIWISSGRSEGGGLTVLNTVREMVKNLPTVTLKESGWQSWPQFRRLVGSMHLLLQPSYTESFNMVTADGISEGVPSVVSDAIYWAPTHWVASADDVFDIARVGRALLVDRNAGSDGEAALRAYIATGLRAWKGYLQDSCKLFG